MVKNPNWRIGPTCWPTLQPTAKESNETTSGQSFPKRESWPNTLYGYHT